MFAVPPDGNPQNEPAPGKPRIQVNWIEFLVSKIVPKSWTDAYLIWKIDRIVGKFCFDPNAECPACGKRDGEMRFAEAFRWPDGSVGALLHCCKVCRATWGEKPQNDFKKWQVKLAQADERGIFDDVKRSA